MNRDSLHPIRGMTRHHVHMEQAESLLFSPPTELEIRRVDVTIIIELGVGGMQQYSDEFKEQVLAEVDQVGNAALVARRYQISENTIYTWMAKRRKNGSVVSLPKAKIRRLKEMEERLKQVSTENERLKRLLAEKELELAILRELKQRVNPR